MKGPFLVFDIGNSYTKYALSTSRKLGPISSHPTPALTESWLRALGRRHPRIPVLLSSVVPAKNPFFARLFGKRLHMLSGLADLGIPIRYQRRDQVGADRVAIAIAISHLYGGPAIAVAFGTAVTFEVVDTDGAYIGGAIAPGLSFMTDYLHEKTALLPKITLEKPRRMIAQNTVEALRVGTVIGYRGLVREILAALRKELGGRKPRVIATGGQASLIAPGLPEIEAVVPSLTLDGLRLWAETVL